MNKTLKFILIWVLFMVVMITGTMLIKYMLGIPEGTGYIR